MAAATKKARFLLALDGPARGEDRIATVPVGVYDSAEECLKVAARIGLPKVPTETSGDELDTALRNNHTGWPVDKDGTDYKPFGWSITHFNADGTLSGYAKVQPYTEYDPGDENSQESEIDQNQDLIWN